MKNCKIYIVPVTGPYKKKVIDLKKNRIPFKIPGGFQHFLAKLRKIVRKFKKILL
jgi:hypothetical protein